MNIFEKLSKITEEIGTVAKDLKVVNYKAVSEGNILSAVKPLEIKYGIYSYPVSRRIVDNGFIEAKNGGNQFYERIEVIYRFVNVEKPEEYIEITSYGDGIDTGDKSVGKAMTYADKYALMKAYKIETGDDPDANASETYSKKTTRPTPPQAPQRKFELNEKLKARCKELDIPLMSVASWKGKQITDLLDSDLQDAITRKEAKLSRAQTNGK